MGQTTRIEWADATWNPVTGCTPVSDGCRNCYAKRMALRLHGMGLPAYKDGFGVHLQPHTLNWPATLRRRSRIFVCSMADLFHESVPEEYIDLVFESMLESSEHVYMLLTKRSGRLRNYAYRRAQVPGQCWPAHVYAGVTVESASEAYRIADLIAVPAKVHFISAEPLLSALPPLPSQGLDWCIVGGETGPGARIMEPNWVRDIRDDCRAKRVPFFFKGWGSRYLGGFDYRLIDCERHENMPYEAQAIALQRMARKWELAVRKLHKGT